MSVMSIYCGKVTLCHFVNNCMKKKLEFSTTIYSHIYGQSTMYLCGNKKSKRLFNRTSLYYVIP